MLELPRRRRAAKSYTPSEAELEAVAASLPADRLLSFIRSLKRERRRLSAAAADAHLAFMRVCADRAFAEDLPGGLDAALGELRYGR